MARTLPRMLYRGLVAAGAPRLMRRIRPGAPVLCFHNVVSATDAGIGDASLHMPLAAFESIIQWLALSYDVVPLGELADRASAGRSVRGLAAVTFDDAYRGALEHAIPILSAIEIPCTVFVVTGFADHPIPTWWDTLAAQGQLSGARREEALTARRGLAAEVLADDVDYGTTSDLPDALLPAGWDQIVRSMSELVAIGSHTVLHPNLTALGDAALDQELGRSRREIQERTGREVDAVAYPYGLWDPRVASAAGRAGYHIGLTLAGGPTQWARDRLTTPRLNVPAGMSIDALACWAAGIRPRRFW
ncbi:MAG: polysaccharide deacetylase family protein [Gemmatimonadetes bacterium]|nr:polysaccharide deacetylase family protein [Gemmatimonadota bacterium]